MIETFISSTQTQTASWFFTHFKTFILSDLYSCCCFFSFFYHTNIKLYPLCICMSSIVFSYYSVYVFMLPCCRKNFFLRDNKGMNRTNSTKIYFVSCYWATNVSTVIHLWSTGSPYITGKISSHWNAEQEWRCSIVYHLTYFTFLSPLALLNTVWRFDL